MQARIKRREEMMRAHIDWDIVEGLRQVIQ
jgi:hypothetical protein